MALPIDIIPNRSPLCFRWQYRADTPAGVSIQSLEGNLPPSVEGALANLIAMTKNLQKENKELWERLEKATAPINAPPVASTKGRK